MMTGVRVIKKSMANLPCYPEHQSLFVELYHFKEHHGHSHSHTHTHTQWNYLLTPGPDAPCPHDFTYFDELARCYNVERDSNKQLMYIEAESACRAINASLANLETPAEVDFVGRLFTWSGEINY